MTRRRVLMWSLYAVFVAAVAEGMARAALSSADLRERLFTNDDASWRLQWVHRQRDRADLGYGIDDWSPTRGWTLKANLRDVPFRGGTVSSNARGVRGAAERGYAKPAGIVRIVILGDSFTFGEEVGDAETYAHHLQELIPESEVLNLGVHGYGHDQMLLSLREEGVKYAPDIVLVGFLPDDMERNVLSFRDYAKPHFAVRDRRLIQTNPGPIPNPEDLLRGEILRSKFADLIGMMRSRYEWRSGRTSAITKELTFALLDEIRKTSESAGAKAAFAYLPVYGEIPRKDDGMTSREKAFFNGCRERGLTALYLQPAFREKARAGAVFKTEGHWGAFEHRTGAEGIAASLRELGWIR